MALGTLRNRGTENEKRAVDGMMERGNFSWATVGVVIQTAIGLGIQTDTTW